VSCVCGLVVLDGSDLLTMDMCGGELGEALPQLSLLSLSASPLRTRVLEARGGKILMVSHRLHVFFILSLAFATLKILALSSLKLALSNCQNCNINLEESI
jgi:hypothetical protein